MTGERRLFTPEQIQLVERTKGKVLGMLNGIKDLSEENSSALAGRIAGFFVEASEVPIFDKTILVSIEKGSKLQLLMVVKEVPGFYTPAVQRLKPEELASADATGQSNHLFVLTNEYLWSGTPGIYSEKVLAEKLNGKSGKEYVENFMPNATFLGELSAMGFGHPSPPKPQER